MSGFQQDDHVYRDRRRAVRVRYFEYAAVMFAVFASFLYYIDSAPLAGTEAHRAIPAHQMVEAGDWLVPRFWGVPYLAKPPMHYWILAFFEWVAGSTDEWVWRLPSVISAALTALSVAVFSNRWFGRPTGFVAGISFLALIALWSQNTKADIDANHTLACVLAAFGIIELAVGGTSERSSLRNTTAWMLFTATMTSAAFLLKGPACLPVLVGAVFSPAIVMRSWRPLRRVSIWLALIVGILSFAAWAVVVWRQLILENADLDYMGVREVARNATSLGWEALLEILTFPFVLAAYLLPVSAVAPVALRKQVLENRSGRQVLLVRALAVTVGVAVLVGMTAGMTNPRYLYIAAPLLCPLVGVVVTAAALRALPDRIQSYVEWFIVSTAGVLAALPVVLALLFVREHKVIWPSLIWIVGPIAVGLAISIIRSVRRQQILFGFGLLLPILVCGALVFGMMQTRDRLDTTSREAGIELRRIVGPQATVWSSNWVRNGPELLYYAGVNVRYCLRGRMTPDSVPAGSWILFLDGEWNRWEKDLGRDAFGQVMTLPTRRRNAILAFYLGRAQTPAERPVESPDDTQ